METALSNRRLPGVWPVRAWGGLDRAARLSLIGLFVIAAAAALLVAYATRYGPSAGSDSVEYLVSARNLLAGRGLGLYAASGRFMPLSLHPPLYPLVLAMLGLLGPTLISVARWLNVGAIFLVSLVLGLGLLRVSRSAATALGFVLTFVTLPATLGQFTGAISEPLSLVFATGSVVWLIAFLDRGERIHLVGAGTCAGLAALARLPWLALLPVGVIALILFGRGSYGRRIAPLSIYSALCLVPTFAWLAWLASQGGSAGPRQWVWPEGNLWYQLNDFRARMADGILLWLPLPQRLPDLAYRVKLTLIGSVALLGAAAGVLSITRISRTRGTPWSRLIHSRALVVVSALALAYVGLLIVTWLFTLPPLVAADLDERILYPLRLVLILIVFLVLQLSGEATGRGRMAAVAGLTLAAAFIWNSVPISVDQAGKLHREGSGYTSRGWRSSETVAWLRGFPTDQALISNETAALLFLLDRPAYDIPELVLYKELEQFTRFGEGDTHADQLFRDCGAVLILFDNAYWQFQQIYDQATDARWNSFKDGLTLLHDAEDGRVLVYDNPDEAGVTCVELLEATQPAGDG